MTNVRKRRKINKGTEKSWIKKNLNLIFTLHKMCILCSYCVSVVPKKNAGAIKDIICFDSVTLRGHISVI